FQKLWCQTTEHSCIRRSLKNTADNEQLIKSIHLHITQNQTARQRDLSKLSKGEGATKEIIRESLLTYGTAPHPMLRSKTSAEITMGRTVPTISHTIIPKNKINKQSKCHKRGMFIVDYLMFAHDLRIGHSRMNGAVIKRWRDVIYKIKISDAIWVRHKSQLRPHIAEIKSTPTSAPL
ncbi:unnamed protein product, partial [Hymenolepis diminuta]